MTRYVLAIIIFINMIFLIRTQQILTTDELENHISPDDLKKFMAMNNRIDTTTARNTDQVYASSEDASTAMPVPSKVDCFGLGSLTSQLPWLFNMQPDSSEKVNTHFYFYSRKQPKRVMVLPDEQFGLEWVDFDPTRKTVMIVHGFMSHSNASWISDMVNAYLQKEDINVMVVDWSKGGDTWKYWKAVANTRRVGSDVTGFLFRLIDTTKAQKKRFHFIGHSLGAHICAYVSTNLGGVHRITGLDPAQPCFQTNDATERLNKGDADFVDVIHTNGRLLKKVGFGMPHAIGDADFYPNGGMKQPGCHFRNDSLQYTFLPKIISKLEQAICSHGRAYLYFTESLLQNNCTFSAHQWNMTYEGVNASLQAVCDRFYSCSEMGINSVGGNKGMPRARGSYFVLTTEKEPYCPSDFERHHPSPILLQDLREGFKFNQNEVVTRNYVVQYADPLSNSATSTTTARSWFRRWFG